MGLSLRALCVHVAIRLVCSQASFLTMDAQTMAAAALAVVVDNSRDAAVRERLSKRGELADNLELARADLEIARDAVRGVLRHLEAGQVRWAKAMLEEAIDDASTALGSSNVQAAREAPASAD